MNLLQKFPSIDNLIISVINSCKRFPFAFISIFTATIVGLWLADIEIIEKEYELQKILAIALLGLPLFISMKMYSERYRWDFWKSLRLQAIGFFLLILYYFLLPKDFFELEKYAIQYSLLYLGCLFLNAIIPFLHKKNKHGFWQYNKSLFLNFLTATLYTHVMGIGLCIALGALHLLFKIEIDSKHYFQIWIVVSLFFHPLIFMSKIPENLDSLDTDLSYPKGLKVFTQYVLLPLVGLYLVILYTYGAKILIEWNWPIGWVSNLILWFSVLSILSLLLLHPLKELKENKWIQIFSTWFFRALIPLIVMLFMAIMQRISDYGITEARYLVLAMAIGLAVVVLYFVISKSKDIRIIPIVISLLAIISAFSVSPISKLSQQSRLESLLIQNNLLVDGELVAPDDVLDFESRKEMSSVVNYLLNTHGIESFEWFLEDSIIAQDNFVQVQDSTKNGTRGTRGKHYTPSSKVSTICSHLGFTYMNKWSQQKSAEWFHIIAEKEDAINISDYTHMYALNQSVFSYNITETIGASKDSKKNIASSKEGVGLKTFLLDSLECNVLFDENKSTFEIYFGDTLLVYDNLGKVQLADTLQTMTTSEFKTKLPPSDLSFQFTGNYYDALIVLHEVNGYLGDTLRISSFEGVLLLKEK